MPKIRCGINNCQFWNEFGCDAKDIRLYRRGSPRMEVGEIGKKQKDQRIDDECQCESFKAKER